MFLWSFVVFDFTFRCTIIIIMELLGEILKFQRELKGEEFVELCCYSSLQRIDGQGVGFSSRCVCLSHCSVKIKCLWCVSTCLLEPSAVWHGHPLKRFVWLKRKCKNKHQKLLAHSRSHCFIRNAWWEKSLNLKIGTLFDILHEL